MTESRTNIFEQRWVRCKVKKLLTNMTLDEKVNQLFFISGPLDPTQAGALAYAVSNNVGGIWFSGGPPFTNDASVSNTVAERRRQIDYTNANVKTKIPLFYGSDNTHSVELNEIVNFPQPHSLQTVALDDIEKMGVVEGEMIASVSRDAGFNLTFAPTAICAFNRRFGRVYESASDKGERVARFCAGFVRGAQAIRKRKGKRSKLYISGICATTKHFIGDGAGVLTDGQIEYGNAIVQTSGSGDYDVYLKNNGAGFKAAIREETGAVMMTFTVQQYNQVANTGQVPFVDPASISQRSYATLKADDFYNHKGIAMSDFESPSLALLDQNLFNYDNFTIGVASANAYAVSIGLDLILAGFFPLSDTADYDTIREFIKSHVQLSRIEDAVSRILSVKVAMGLFSPKWSRYRQQNFPINAALAAYQQAFDSLVYTTPIVTNPTPTDPPALPATGFLLPSTPILNDPTKSRTILFLGRESGFDPQFSIDSNPSDAPDTELTWNDFYNDMGIQCGGWSTFASFSGVTGSRTLLGTDPISGNQGGVSSQTSANINSLYSKLRSTPMRLPNGKTGTAASTILDGFNNAEVTTASFQASMSYDPTQNIALLVIGEFAYQEQDGEIDALNSCSVFDITRTSDLTYNPQEGIKLSDQTYQNLKSAYKQGLQIVTIIVASRDQTSWNYTAPLYAEDSDSFGLLSITDVSSAIVYSLLPGTSGGDAIVQFLYDTPLELGNKRQPWVFNRTNQVAYLPFTDPPSEYCGA